MHIIKRQGTSPKGCCPPSAHRDSRNKVCSVHFESGVHHLPICAMRAQKSIAGSHGREQSMPTASTAPGNAAFSLHRSTTHETHLNAAQPVQPATSRALGPPWSAARRKQRRVCRTASIACAQRSKRNLLAGEWDPCSACCSRKAGQAFILAWQTAIRLAGRSFSPRTAPAWPTAEKQATNERTTGASAQATNASRSSSTSSKFPANRQAFSGVRASSRHRTPTTGVAGARLALRQSELASALARVKRHRHVIGWRRNNGRIANAMARSLR